MPPTPASAVLALAALGGCIEMDGFMFDPIGADSVDGDYHGLPLHQGDAPEWVDETSIERELYLAVPSGEVLTEASPDTIHGVFLPAPTGCPATECPLVDLDVAILYQHGNSGNLWRYWYRAVALWDLGASVFVYTYRGYGLSGGEPTADNVFADAETALRYLGSRPEIGADTLVVAYGYSMGAIPTSYLVGSSPDRDLLDAVVLESGLDSPGSIVQISTGTAFPGPFFLEDTHFDGPEHIAGVSTAMPILHLHGAKDSRVLPVQAERYHAVLDDLPGYTHYIGKTDHPAEEWLALAAHRNVPDSAFAAVDHISDYWGHEANPGHCCVHPGEYADPAHAGFLAEVGSTDGAAMVSSAADYADLVSAWLADQARR